MDINIEHLKTLDAIARMGSVLKAAQKLNKVHSAILYSMRVLEEQTGLQIFDRSGYRTRLTAFGQRLWQESQKLLEAKENLEQVLTRFGGGWEPILKVVFDGVLPLDFILQALRKLKKMGAPTKVLFFSDYLSAVEETFNREAADIMVSVLPPQQPHLMVEKGLGLKLHLVAHKSHELFKSSKAWSIEDLKNFTFLTVRGSDFRLRLSTTHLEESSHFHLSDFISKKEALMQGLGYGWMPEHLITRELKKRVLLPVRWQGKNQQTLATYLCYRRSSVLGQAMEILWRELKSKMSN